MTDVWNESNGRVQDWVSGAWTLQVRGDELADIAFDGRIVLRSIRAVVRDRDWNTADWVVERIHETRQSIQLLMSTSGYEAQMRGKLRVEAAGGELNVYFNAESAVDYLTCRAGLVVLHPHRLAGTPLAITHVDGQREAAVFPRAVSPHQPAFDIAALEWNEGRLQIDVAFSGDVFEMEDQRNWTDASYKTYSRPLALPYPYRLVAGEQVSQSLRVTSSPTQARPAPSADQSRITLTSSGSPFPDIALSNATAPDPAPDIDPIGQALMVELDLRTPNWRAALGRAASTDLPLDVRIVVPVEGDTELSDAARTLAGLTVMRIGAFWADGEAPHISDHALVAQLRAALSEAGLTIPLLAGARSHFTELNRGWSRIPRDADGIAFTVTPLFHSLSTHQLIESLAVQRIVVDQAARMAKGTPLHIGPVTLRPRFNNVATEAPVLPTESDLRAGYGAELSHVDDRRQLSPELAAWTVASIAALAVPGVASLTYFEEWGARGVRNASGQDLPTAAVLRLAASLGRARLLSGKSPDGLIWAVGATTTDTEIVLVANVDSITRNFTVVAPTGQIAVDVPPGEWRALYGSPS